MYDFCDEKTDIQAVSQGTLHISLMYILVFLIYVENIPEDWDAMPTDAKGKERHFHLVTFIAGSPEYNTVESQFNKTMAKGSSYNQIVSIQWLQNRQLYQQYMLRKREMDPLNPPGHRNEQWLFHRTKSVTLTKINAYDFNRMFRGEKVTSLYDMSKCVNFIFFQYIVTVYNKGIHFDCDT